MTVAPLTRVPSDAHPGTDPPCPDPAPATAAPAARRPRMRAPGHEPEPLAAGVPHPRRHSWTLGGPARGTHPAGERPAGERPAAPERPRAGAAAGPSAAGQDHDPAGQQTGSSTAPAAGFAPDGAGVRWNGSTVPPDAPGTRPDSGPGAVPPPRERAGALVRSVLEVLAGRRQPVQLAGAATPRVLRYLAASRPPTVRSVAPGRVHVRRPHPEAAEVVAVCRIGDRTRAIALRLDVHRDDGEAAWICTALRLL